MKRKRREKALLLSEELADADLGDERLNRRLGILADLVAQRPEAGFPEALDDAELEAAYRFFGNERVTPEAILAPHFRQSALRAREHERVLVVHDTTEFEFGGQKKREGLGRLIRPGQGFFGHFSLAVTADGTRKPLGLLSIETIFRHDKPKPRGQRRRNNTRGESIRWRNGVETSEEVLAGGARAIHVMDREGDSYAILSSLDAEKRSFVIRSAHDRVLAGEEHARLRATAAAAEATLEREVPLSPRPRVRGPKGKRHPARRYRMANLSFAAISVQMPCPKDLPKASSSVMPVNVVHVFETQPPKGEPAVEWFLLTDLPVNTAKAIAFVVDCYRARWTIEEYFKALKTGCQYERRQLESARSLLNALAIFAPVAWRLLLLRHLARADPAAPAASAITPTQLEVLRAVSKKPLPKKPTARDALLAIAALGGHIKNNGDPGWLVLGRGLHDLLLLEMGWQAGRKSDQS